MYFPRILGHAIFGLVTGLCGIPTVLPVGEPATVDKLADALGGLTASVLPDEKAETPSVMAGDDLRQRIRKANDRSSAAWRKINSREDWEPFRDAKLEALRESLGRPLPPANTLNTRVTRTLTGDGHRIENLVFETRPGLWVTANLYLPAKAAASMPGILICHSHHTPKEHGELQDMGMTWARAGCLVLVMDQLGHGERRQHPFRTADDFAQPYRVDRQDYYFRYDTGIQLHLVGESLVGWMVWDLIRGVDLLLARPGVDPERIILLGAVAGGGDPAAVAGALDRRIAAVVPFNFGGPQPETRYPLPDEAESRFNYAGSGSWESTRNLRRSAADGFLPWVIVGSIAPRRLVYAHEFSWDRRRDPVWKRLEKIYELHGAREHLAFAHGRGELKGRPPEATHCTHIGREHREMIHPVLKRWFGISVTQQDEYQNRRDPSDLQCITPEIERELHPRRLCDLLPELGAQRVADARKQLAALPPDARRAKLRTDWARLLSDLEPKGKPEAHTPGKDKGTGSVCRNGPKGASHKPNLSPSLDGATIERITLQMEPGIVVPMILLLPPQVEGKRLPLVVGLAQAGKEGFLRHRAREIAALLAGGAAVCLPDARGTGETGESSSRGRYSGDVALSSTELMLGGTAVGARLGDLRSVLKYLRGRGDLDPERIALWGDSFAAVNPEGTDFKVPRHMDGRPKESEPLGGLLALLGALFDEDVCAVYVRGGLSDFHSVLSSQFVQIPHDVVIPGVLTAGDLCDVAAALGPRPLRLDEMVDGLNRRLTVQSARRIYRPALDAYREAGAADRVSINRTALDPAGWLLEQVALQR